jgi:hypothetical protein
MNNQFSALVERLRVELIGEPEWQPAKAVYEYIDQSAKVVAVLKLIRAAQGVNALEVLLDAGFLVDFGAVVRCVNDCVSEVYFILENYPEVSANVTQFVKAFFESNIDHYLKELTPPVASKKIRAAQVRFLRDQHDQGMSDLLTRIFRTFSGYVHANYAHIMETYKPSQGFNLEGVPDLQPKLQRSEYIKLSRASVLMAGAFAAWKFGRLDLRQEINGMLSDR